MNHGEYGKWGIDEQHKELFINYYNNYVYDSNDKDVFNNMLKLIFEKHKSDNKYYRLKYFFINEHNYYIYMFEEKNDVMYQYDNTNNSLKKLFEMPFGGELEYFKAK